MLGVDQIMETKYAIVTLTNPSDHARIYHAFLYLFDLKASGIQAELFLDGTAVRIVEELEKNPSDMIKPLYDRAVREELIQEACGFCANAFKVRDVMMKSKINLSPENEHIRVGDLAKRGYQILVI